MLAPPEKEVAGCPRPRSLLLEPELLDDRVVAALVVLLEIAQVCAAIGNHLEKTTAGMVILVVLLEMLRQFINAAGQDSDLNIGRAGVGVMTGRVLDDGRLYALR